MIFSPLSGGKEAKGMCPDPAQTEYSLSVHHHLNTTDGTCDTQAVRHSLDYCLVPVSLLSSVSFPAAAVAGTWFQGISSDKPIVCFHSTNLQSKTVIIWC